MSSDKGTKWPAPQHTIAKIEMLRKYLVVWFSILGTKFRGADLWYIDGFAGPGEYTNYPEGSPIAALRAADEALVLAKNWIAGKVHCVFIEEDPERFSNLQAKLAEFPQDPRVARHLFNSTFVDGIAELRKQTVNPFRLRQPVFAFIDPFGVKGLPFNTVKGFLTREGCEVLINLDSDGIARVYSAGQFANHRQRLSELFGDSHWEQELGQVARSNLGNAILSMYKIRLREVPAKYAFAFEMQSKAGRMDYHLVFATQHPLGLEKMKEVMKQFTQNGAYVFCDEADSSQQALFRFDDPAFHASQMAEHFSGQDITYSQAADYALNESPFTNPKKMLKALEDAGRISVTSNEPTRRTGTYPDHAQRSMQIKFLS